jgi:hypothetical protein
MRMLLGLLSLVLRPRDVLDGLQWLLREERERCVDCGRKLPPGEPVGVCKYCLSDSL